MKHYTFSQIKTKVFEWFQKEAIKLLADQDEFELSKNDEKVLLINFTFNSCLAQLTVYDPAFAPYQFVSFEAMTLDSR